MPIIPPSCIDIDLIPDWKWAVVTIAQEARSEPILGQVAVAEVIRNRMKYKFFSDGTVRDTVLRPYQFSGWNTNDPNRVLCAGLKFGDKVTQSAISALVTAFRDRSEYAEGSVSYHTLDTSPDWAISPEFEVATVIGRHKFYRKVGLIKVAEVIKP